MNDLCSAQPGYTSSGYGPPKAHRNIRTKIGPRRTFFFLGLGCENLQHILDKDWDKTFSFIPLKNMGVESQAQLLLDQGFFPTNGVVFAHSAGCHVATCYVALINQMVQDGQLPEMYRVGKLVLVAPPPPPGRLLPYYIIKLMLDHEKYWSKGMPWAKPFMLSHLYNEILMVGDDMSQYMRDAFEDIASLWFPRVIAANFTKPLNLAWRLRGPIEKTLQDQGVEVIVYGGQIDHMIRPWLAEKVARIHNGEYIHLGCSHMGVFLGYNQDETLRLFKSVIAGRIEYKQRELVPRNPDELFMPS